MPVTTATIGFFYAARRGQTTLSLRIETETDFIIYNTVCIIIDPAEVTVATYLL